MKNDKCVYVSCEECMYYKLGESKYSDEGYCDEDDWYCSYKPNGKINCMYCKSCDYYNKEKNVCDTTSLDKENINPMTREEVAELPTFESHKEARIYLKIKFGDKFKFDESVWFLDNKVYYYKLILNMKNYRDSIDEMKNGEGKKAVDKYHRSFQTIEIEENGEITVLHIPH